MRTLLLVTIVIAGLGCGDHSLSLEKIRLNGGDGELSGTGESVELTCGVDCDTVHRSLGEGSMITLVAEPYSGSTFAGWGGDCDSFGFALSGVLRVEGSMECTGTFSRSDVPDGGFPDAPALPSVVIEDGIVNLTLGSETFTPGADIDGIIDARNGDYPVDVHLFGSGERDHSNPSYTDLDSDGLLVHDGGIEVRVPASMGITLADFPIDDSTGTANGIQVVGVRDGTEFASGGSMSGFGPEQVGVSTPSPNSPDETFETVIVTGSGDFVIGNGFEVRFVVIED